VKIAVVAASAEQAVRFVVADDGPGMPPAIRARAFDPFFCGREAGRHRGLGLPKAFRAVQANGGQMALESTPGKGTTVRMTFPIIQENEGAKMTNG
jgi:signal transduction histidine kinase